MQLCQCVHTIECSALRMRCEGRGTTSPCAAVFLRGLKVRICDSVRYHWKERNFIRWHMRRMECVYNVPQTAIKLTLFYTKSALQTLSPSLVPLWWHKLWPPPPYRHISPKLNPTWPSLLVVVLFARTCFSRNIIQVAPPPSFQNVKPNPSWQSGCQR